MFNSLARYMTDADRLLLEERKRYKAAIAEEERLVNAGMLDRKDCVFSSGPGAEQRPLGPIPKPRVVREGEKRPLNYGSLAEQPLPNTMLEKFYETQAGPARYGGPPAAVGANLPGVMYNTEVPGTPSTITVAVSARGVAEAG